MTDDIRLFIKKTLSGTALSPKQSVWLFFTRAKFCPTRGGTLNNLKEKGNNVNTRIPFSKKSYETGYFIVHILFPGSIFFSSVIVQKGICQDSS